MYYKATIVVLSCLLVESAAVQTYQTHLSFNASDMVMSAENSCRSVVGTSGTIQHHVHVCEDSNRVCFFTTMECCYGIGLPISSAKVSVGGKNVTVSFYTAEKGTALCYNILGNLESCNTKPECLQSCIPADPVCLNNTLNGLESCSDGACQCMPGYAGPDCCECDLENSFFKFDDKCIPLCKAHCEVPDVMGGCTMCRGDYSLPDCCQCRMNAISCNDTGCECREGYGGLDCCECAPGYYRSEDGTCKAPCTNNTVSCVHGVCTCKEGYAGPGCCECDVVNDYILYLGICKPLCTSNCQVPNINGGCVSCRGDYSLPDCCQCRMNAISCSDTGCECREGYGGLDCCECAPGYYRSEDGTCKAACVDNAISCESETCVCKENYGGVDCCTYKPPSCNRDQDIYFLLDTTLSLGALPFCEMLHTVEMITSAINKGNNSRTGAYIYPKSQTTTDEDMQFIDIERDECLSSIDKYHNLVLEFSFSYKRGYASKIYATITLPVYVIDLLRRDILAKISSQTDTTKPSRRNVAIVITDGANDGNENELSTAITKLTEETGTTVISAGLGTPISVDNYEQFRKELKVLANGNARNVVSASSTRQLNKGIVQKLTENGVLCTKQGDELLKILEESNGNLYCACNSHFFQYNGCKTRCLPRKRRQCRQPPSCS